MHFLCDFMPLFVPSTMLLARLFQAPHYDPTVTLSTDIAFSILSFDVWAGLTRVRGGHLVGPRDGVPGEVLMLLSLFHLMLLFAVARLNVGLPAAWVVAVALALLGYGAAFLLVAYARANNLPVQRRHRRA